MKNGKFVWVIVIVVVVALLATVCYGYFRKATLEVKNPIVTMEVKDYGTIKIELYPEYAPNTVQNFVTLANRGFYNGLTFHRVVKDFMIQGGGIKEDGTSVNPKLSNLQDGAEDAEYSIKGEFISNGYTKNTLKLEEGVIAMARADYSSISSELLDDGYNSASAQFFIMTKANTSVDGLYAPFGKVVEGLDVVHKIEEVKVKSDESQGENAEVSTPVTKVVISSVKVDTMGTEYPLPETQEPFDYYTWLYEQYGIDPSAFMTGTETETETETNTTEE